jgi:hypothetical protein
MAYTAFVPAGKLVGRFGSSGEAPIRALVKFGYVTVGTRVGVKAGSAVPGSVATAVEVEVEVEPLCVRNGVGCDSSSLRTSTLKVQPEIKKSIASRQGINFFIHFSLEAALYLKYPLIMRCGGRENHGTLKPAAYCVNGITLF